MLSRRDMSKGLLALGLAGSGRRAFADSYPSKPVRWVVPFAAGGATDIVGRLLTEALSQKLGQRFFVDNRGGAGGLVGTQVVVQAPPDGYTIGGVSFNYLVYPTLFKNLDFDILSDVTPLSYVATYPSVLAVHPASPYKSVKDIVEAARKNPGSLQFASSGIGTAAHIAGELLNRDAGVKMIHVAYRGGGPANADLVAGHVTMHFTNIGSSMDFIRNGMLRPIAVAMPKRMEALPHVPTMIEEGYPGFVINEFQAVIAPKATPADIVEKLSKGIRDVLNEEKMRERFVQMGGEVVASTPAGFADFIRSDSAKWIEVAKGAGIQPQ